MAFFEVNLAHIILVSSSVMLCRANKVKRLIY